MSLENTLAALHGGLFLREFSYSAAEFDPSTGSRKELADQIVLIGEQILVFQLKERTQESSVPFETWFENKVRKKATKQIRTTLRLLAAEGTLKVRNLRGHVIDLAASRRTQIHKICIFCDATLPPTAPYTGLHLSRTAGVIHIFRDSDYMTVCEVLATGAEIVQYLSFRQEVGLRFGKSLTSEAALLGQFLTSDAAAAPSERYKEHVARLIDDRQSFDLSHLLNGLADRIESFAGSDGYMGYYRILEQFQLLTREELREVKFRIGLALDAARADTHRRPMRAYFPRLGVGFVVVPLRHSEYDVRMKALHVFTMAAKYAGKCSRQVGISVAHASDHVMIDWILEEGDWVAHPELEAQLTSNNPFYSVSDKRAARYQFVGDTP